MLKTTLSLLLQLFIICYANVSYASNTKPDMTTEKQYLSIEAINDSSKIINNSLASLLIRGKYRKNIDFLKANFNNKNIIENSYFEMNYKNRRTNISFNYSIKF